MGLCEEPYVANATWMDLSNKEMSTNAFDAFDMSQNVKNSFILLTL